MKEIVRILAKKQLMEMKEDEMEDEMEDKEEGDDMEEEKNGKGKMHKKMHGNKKAMLLMMLKSKMK
jgi:hypothetical protein